MTDTVLDVPLTPADEALMVLFGFAYRAPDGILTLTETGNAFVRAWCREQAPRNR